jgi:micrococcal nuclease
VKHRLAWISLAVAVVSLAVFFLYEIIRNPGMQTSILTDTAAEPMYTISSIYDGDTLRVAERGESIRVLGIDAPEISPKECYGLQARDLARELAPVGSKITIREDPEQPSPDRYGRTLAYVVLPDGRDLAEELLAQGAVQVYTQYPVARTPGYLQTQDQAQAEGVGLWGHC